MALSPQETPQEASLFSRTVLQSMALTMAIMTECTLNTTQYVIDIK